MRKSETSKEQIIPISRKSAKKAKLGRLLDDGGNSPAINLQPGLRDRLIEEMDKSKILEEERLQYLSMLTGRAPQTVRRWLAKEEPGLPDLISFASLCFRFDADANWMLGLAQTRFALPKAEAGSVQGDMPGWAVHIVKQVTENAVGCETAYMAGDDMEPKIKNGAPMLVDMEAKEIDANGTYLLEYQGKTLVRHVEIRIGEGLLLSCENVKYKPTILKDKTAVKKLGLKVLGRVKLAVGVENL